MQCLLAKIHMFNQQRQKSNTASPRLPYCVVVTGLERPQALGTSIRYSQDSKYRLELSVGRA